MLLATKSDLTYERKVTEQEGKAMATKQGIGFMEVSAKADLNIKEGFELLVQDIHRKYEARGEIEGVTHKREVIIGNKDHKDKKNCSC